MVRVLLTGTLLWALVILVFRTAIANQPSSAVQKFEQKGITRIIFVRMYAFQGSKKSKTDYILGLSSEPPVHHHGDLPPRIRSSAAFAILAGYEDLKVFLTRKFGCSQLAEEVVQETWLWVRRLSEPTEVEHPRTYLFRIAANLPVTICVQKRHVRGTSAQKWFRKMSPMACLFQTPLSTINSA